MLWVAVINSYYAVNNWILLNRFNFVSTCLYYFIHTVSCTSYMFLSQSSWIFEIFLTLYCKCSLVVCKTTYNINSDLCSFVKLPNVIENKNDNLWGVQHSFVVRIDPSYHFTNRKTIFHHPYHRVMIIFVSKSGTSSSELYKSSFSLLFKNFDAVS